MHLPAFQQSVFLQALGWAIANSIWQSALLFVVYRILVSCYTYTSAKFKYNLSTALLFSSFLWFVATFFSRFFYLLTPAEQAYVSVHFKNAVHLQDNVSLQDFILPLITALPYLSIAYISLLLIFLIKLINSCNNIRFVMKNGLCKPGAEWRVFVDKVANQVYLNKKINIWFSQYVDVPATIGFFKPVILIPLASLNQLTTDQMEAVILHEICHIKSNDYLINLFIASIETILFFNPFVILLGTIIKKERENCCDDFVLQYQYDRYSYASALLVLERSRKQQLRLALGATSGRKPLLLRIKRIMEVKTTMSDYYGQKLFALVLSAGIIVSIGWLMPEKKIHQSGTKSPNQISVAVHLLPAEAKKSLVLYPAIKYNTPLVRAAQAKSLKGTTPFTQTTKAEKIPAADALALKSRRPQGIDPSRNIPLNIVNAIVQQKQISITQINKLKTIGAFSQSFFSDLQLLQNVDFDFNVTSKEVFDKKIEALSISLFDVQQPNKGKPQIKHPAMMLSADDDKAICAPGDKEFTNDASKEFNIHMFTSADRKPRQKIIHKGKDSLVFFKDDGISFFIHNNGVDINDFPPPPPPPSFAKKNKIATSPSIPQPEISYNFTYPSPPKLKLQAPPSIRIDQKNGCIIINGEKMNFPQLKKNQIEKLINNIVRENSKRSVDI